MSGSSLSPSSYVVLGLLALRGPGTSYDLARWADESVAFFWAFPRSQLYAEPERLVKAGLLVERREPQGRRRRTYTITPKGRAALKAWLRHPTQERREIRDPGLLKLFFAAVAGEGAVAALAAEQAELHDRSLREYEQLEPRLVDEPLVSAKAALELGLRYERLARDFWRELARRKS